MLSRKTQHCRERIVPICCIIVVVVVVVVAVVVVVLVFVASFRKQKNGVELISD